jgi:hypothetical protein
MRKTSRSTAAESMQRHPTPAQPPHPPCPHAHRSEDLPSPVSVCLIASEAPQVEQALQQLRLLVIVGLAFCWRCVGAIEFVGRMCVQACSSRTRTECMAHAQML